MPLSRILLLALVFIALPARAGAPVDTLAADSEARWVPFELTPGNQIRFRARINGRAVDALLDTGVSDSAVSSRFAKAAGMTPLVSGRADAIGGGVALNWTALDRIEFGGLRRSGGRVAIIAADPRATGAASIDLFVGADLLAAHALDIDYAARRFRLLPSGRLPFRGAISPLRLAGSSRLYLTELPLGNQRPRAVMVDTGDGAMVTLTRAAWRASATPAGPLTTAIAHGLGGPVETELAVLPALRIEGFVAREVELRIEPDDGFSARRGVAGRIGGGLLRRARVLLDPHAGRMVLAGTADPSPLTRSTSGLLLAQDGARLKVLHVMRGGPAAASGWTEGTEICAVDGATIPAAYAASDLARWSVDTPGRTVRLALCDGSERSLTLARFY